MKLSMWMIANRLRAMEPVVELDEDAPVTLNSARLAYATNCVYLSKEGEDEVLCKGDGGTLRLSGIDLHTSFEVMQSVFDYFEDWNTMVYESIREERYQDAVDLAWQVLQNPLLLFDGNNRVLGITRQYHPDALDAEWSYISRFGYSSVDAVRQFRGSSFDRSGIAAFENTDNRNVKYGNITVYLNWGDVVCGRLTLLSYDHPLNPGDAQLMEHLAGILRPILVQMFLQSEESSTVDVLLNLLLDKPCGSEQLETRLRYTSWKMNDNYFVSVVKFLEEGQGYDMGLMQIRQILVRYIPNSVVLKNGSDLVIVSTRDIRKDQVAAETLDSLMDSNPVAVGFSMEGRGVRSIGVLYAQARYAIRRGREKDPASRVYDFFSVATDFMLEQPLKDAVGAVMPRLGELWEERRDGDELLETMCIYISQNRSAVKTASALYIHRNTVLYRVQKVEETLGLDFHNSYDRHYFLTALRALQLWELRRREEGTE